MNIEWNKVTWYSKLAAAIIFIICLPALAFYFGFEYGRIQATPLYESKQPARITIQTNSSANANLQYFQATTPISNSAGNYSNIVGYFGGGEYFIYVPQWIPDHWKEVNLPNGGMKFVLNESVSGKDFSDITITLATSSEVLNAETLYSQSVANDDKALCIRDTRCEVQDNDSSIFTSEILLSRVGDSRIYHVARILLDGSVEDRFYIDGKKTTATIMFTANTKESYAQYAPMIRDFVQGIGAGQGAQG